MRKYLIMYQFIFSNLFPKYYGKFNNRGIKNNIEFNSIYENYLKETTANWQKNEFLEALPFPVYDEESDKENQNHEEKQRFEEKKKKNIEEEKKQKRLKRKLEMQKQKEILEEKLKENTEKFNKIKKM